MPIPNQNLCLRFGSFTRTKNGRLVRRQVEQTPVSAQYKNEAGFYNSDITMLIKASERGDTQMFEKLLNRLQMFDDTGSDKSVKQLFNEWKPAYLQTSSELEAWPAYLASVDKDLFKELYGDLPDKVLGSESNVSASGDVSVSSNSE